MPQRTIKNTKKGNISFLAGGNYDSLYSSILKVVGRDAPFAPMNITSNSVAWMSTGSEVYKSIADAPVEIQGILGLMWEQLKKDLLPRLQAQKMEYVLDIPDMTYVFYAETDTSNDSAMKNRYKLLVTGWACKYSKTQDEDGDLGLKKHIFEASGKHQNVRVKVLNADNTPLAEARFIYKYDNLVSQEMKSNSNGYIDQGLCVVGSVLSFTYIHTGQTRTLTVQKNIEDYTLVFAPMVKLTLKVVDQNERPLQSHNVSIEYGDKRYNVQTDGLGILTIDDLLYVDPNMQLMVNVHGYGSECFSVIYPETNITMHIVVPETIRPNIVVLREGEPVANYSIRVSGALSGVYSSDQQGKVGLDTLEEGSAILVESITETASQEFIIEKGREHYVFNLPTLEKQPLPFACFLKVVRGELHNPVPNFYVDIKGGPIDGGKFTDLLGVIPLGEVFVGDTISVTPDGIQESTTILIEEGKSEYLIVLQEESQKVSCHIKVVSGEDLKPVPDYRLGIQGESINGMFSTDGNGIIPLFNMQVGESINVYLSESETPETFTILEHKEEYIIYLKKPDYLQPSYIKVVRGGELEPVPNYTLKIDSEVMQGFYQTDASGILSLGEQKPGTIFLCATDLNLPPIEIIIVEGQEEYLVKIDDVAPVGKGDIVVTLLDKDIVTPVHPATITLTNSRKETFTCDNDASGSIIVPRSFFTDKEKIRMNVSTPRCKVKTIKFRYNEGEDHYIIHLTDPFNWKPLLWLLLPLLLFLLCLINFNKDIAVHAEDQMGNPIPAATVRMDYKEHALYKNGEFFYSRPHNLSGVTDANGDYVFKNVPTSVYSCIFYCFKRAEVTVSPSQQIPGTQSVNKNAGLQSTTIWGTQAATQTTRKFLFNWKKKVRVILYDEAAHEVVDMLFRTLDAKTMDVLPDCSLQIITSMSNVTSPTNSGNGSFLVQGLYADETITIIASKSGFGMNDVTVRDVPVSELLSADQSRRDIPLKKDMLPCDAGESGLNDVDAYTVSAPQSYNMGKSSGTFEIIYETGNACEDCIDLYNHNPGENYASGVKVFTSGMVTTDGIVSTTVSFSNGSIITAIVTTGSSSGSMWNYRLTCPQ